MQRGGQRQCCQFRANVGLRACERHGAIRRHGLRHGRSATGRRIGHDRASRKAADHDLRQRLRQRIVDGNPDIVTKSDGFVFVSRLLRRRQCHRIGDRVDTHSDGRARSLDIAIRTLRRNRDDGHAGKHPAFVRRRQKIDIRHLRGRERIGFGPIACNRERIFVAVDVGDLGVRIDTANFDHVRFRTVDQISERCGEIVKMHKGIFVGRLVVASRGYGIGNSLDIDMVIEIHCLPVQVSRQRRIDIALDGRDGDTKRYAAMKILRRRHCQRLQQGLDVIGIARDQEGAIRLQHN